MRRYVVKSGETLWGIWERDYKGKIGWNEFKEQFRKLNAGRDPNKILAGETILLPDIPSGGFLVRIASEHPTMYAISTFALGALFMVGVLYITKKLKL